MNGKILKIISDILALSVTPENSIENTEGRDSLKTLQIVMLLDEPGYSIPLEKIADIKAVSDVLALTEQANA